MLPQTLASALAVMPMPVVMIGPSSRIEALNDAAAGLFGSDGTGRHYITLLRQPEVLEAIERTAADGQRRQTRFVGSDADRDTLWRVTLGPVPMQAGTGILLSFEDMTALEESSQIRRDFVANVSHELRTPLTALLGFIETLRGAARDDPAARDRFLGIMEREAGRMAHLVDDLLSLSRVEQEVRVRPRESVELDAVIGQAVNVLAPLAEQAGIELDVTLPSGPVIVPGDAAQLHQMVTNLIENALKYAAGGKRIEVTLSAAEDQPQLRAPGVRFSVRDHGDGIESHHIARLTERFYRVDSHRSRELGGTGLGLAIVKHIVSRHRGRLRIESVVGEGSTFTVILPTG